MLFSSPAFFLFFAIYFLIHLVVPARLRLSLIILGSTIFYGFWNPFYIWVPHALTLIAYLGARWVVRPQGIVGRRFKLILVVVLLLAPLAFVKYGNFVYTEILGAPFNWRERLPEFALPLGISFVTFTLIAYLVDVYRGRYPVERRLWLLAGLVLFFPHLIAGPILRPHDLLPQLSHPNSALRNLRARIIFGLAIFSLGLLKKLVFADPIAEFVDNVYASGNGVSAAEYLLAIYGFSLQIYCDFSGYTDMALGAAMALGIRLPRNFRQPYASKSISEFWRRWHITLSSWLRDYVYIPLGGNRVGRPREFANVVITMAIGGLWHGANWTFILWGVIHGLAIGVSHSVSNKTSKLFESIPQWVFVLITFHFVSATWILFRAPNMDTAWRVFTGPFVAPWGGFEGFLTNQMFALLLLGLFLIFHRWDDHRIVRRLACRLPPIVFWSLIILSWMLAITVSAGSSAKFIYFDF